MKKLIPIITMAFMAVGVSFALAPQKAVEVSATDVSIVNVFSSETMQKGVTNYTSSWENKSGLTLTLSNFNNNNKGWSFVRAGRKDYTSVATIVSGKVSNTIKKVVVTVDSIVADKVNSAKIYVSSSSDFSSSSQYTTTVASGKMTYTITSPAANRYYKLEYDLQKNSNGFVQISEVDFVYESTATLQSIQLTNDGAKTVYYDGDAVSFDGIKAIGTMSDSTHPDLTSACTITADKETLHTGDTKITYSATHPSGLQIADLELTISTSAVAITGIEPSGNYRTEFVEKQKFTFGTGKIKVINNNGTTPTVNPTAAGVTVMIGETNITGQDYFMKLSDNGKNLSISYGGFSFQKELTVTSYANPDEGYWSPVTDVSELSVGMDVIIVAGSHNYSMGAYTNGNNINAIETSKDGDNKISNFIPGVQIYTLAAGSESNTYAFEANSVYLAATGGTSSNYLKTEDTISTKSSFAITIEAGVMKIAACLTGDGARNTMRFNPTDFIFSCYAASSTTGSLACLYKFTAQAKSADQIAVENFCKNALHLDDTDLTNYIDPNDATAGTACKGVSGYYATAKAAYNALTADQKEIFATSSDTLINWGRLRLAAWANANGEEFNAASYTFSAIYHGITVNNENVSIYIVVAVSVIAVSFIGVYLNVRRRKAK